MRDFDKDKAHLFFLHAVVAAQKYSHKLNAHQKLSEQLEKIKEMNLDDKLRRELAMLEHRISEVVVQEKSIMSVQKSQDEISRDMAQRVRMLEKRITEFQELHKRREHAVAELERRYAKKISRYSMIKKLRSDLTSLELMHENLIASKKVAKSKLNLFAKKIELIKARIKQLET
ncbi:MAG: hypothetical protein AABX52_01815 [Nanoarchaeota archaeon]